MLLKFLFLIIHFCHIKTTLIFVSWFCILKLWNSLIRYKFFWIIQVFYILKSRKVNMKVFQSCRTLGKPLDYTVYEILQARILEWIFPTQGLNLGLLHCRQILYQLSHKGSPRILGWLAYPFSSGSSWSRNRTGVSCIAGGFFTNWALREAIILKSCHLQIGIILLLPFFSDAFFFFLALLLWYHFQYCIV